MVDRIKLLDQLKKLSESKFEELLLLLGVDPSQIRGSGVTQTQRAIDLIRYLELEVNGLTRLEETLDELAFLKDVSAQINAEVKSVSKLAIFNYPNKVCNILAKYDLHSQSWRYDGDIQRYLCSTPYFNIGSVGSFGLANNIAFYAESKLASTIQIVKLVLNINNELTKPVALQKFNRLTLALFEELSIPIPDGLMPSIHEEKPNKFNQTYGRVELTIEKYKRVETWSVIIQSLTDEEPQKYDDLSSEKNVDYTRLRDLLADGNWKEADEETLAVMLKAAGREKEDCLDIEFIRTFPCADLCTIDRLWVKYSDGRFGFSVQKRIWENVGGKPGEYDYEIEIYKKLGDRLGWCVEGGFPYDSYITFYQNASEGHLPLGLGRSDERGTSLPRLCKRAITLKDGRIDCWGGWGGTIGVSFLASRLVECNI